jgi:HAD superfamily hydrolase (TIGR01509 family)
MSDLKAIVFDVDGTLADTEETHRVAFNQAFREFGLEWEWTPKLYAELLAVSGGRERMQAYAESLGDSFRWPRNPSEFFRKVHGVKTAHYARLVVEGNVPLRPGVRRLIDEARQHGVRLGIATSSRYSNVNALLRNNVAADWESWFDVVASCDIVEEKKPSPAVYDYVLNAMQLRSGDCIAIEDTENGNLSALRAGIKTVITTHYYTRGRRFAGASLVLDHLGEPGHAFHPSGGEFWDAEFVDLALLSRILANESQAAIAGKNAA